jgi:tryptophanyl-tRNA synthetase
VSFQYLKFFLFDDEDLERIRREYTSGTMSTSELKTKLIEVLCKFVEGFQQNRTSITSELVQASMEIRNIEFP